MPMNKSEELAEKRSLAYLLRTVFKSIREKPAVIYGDTEYTFKELEERINSLINAFLDLGIKKGDKIAVLLYNCNQYLEVFLACAMGGTTIVNVNPRYVPSEIKYVVDDSDAVALVLADELVEKVNQIRPELEKLKHYIVVGKDVPSDMLIYEGLIQRYPKTEPKLSWKVMSDDLIALIYTSGTTGLPKGVMWPQWDLIMAGANLATPTLDNTIKRLADLPKGFFDGVEKLIPIPGIGSILASNFVRSILKMPLTQQIVHGVADLLLNNLTGLTILLRTGVPLIAGRIKLICACPLYHTVGLASLVTGLAGITPIYLTSRTFDPKELWETVEKHKANAILFVGDAFAKPMVEELERKHYDLSSLIAIANSGGIWSPPYKKGLLKFSPNLLLYDHFGQTEMVSGMGMVSGGGDEKIDTTTLKVRTSGRAKMRVVDDEGRDVKLGSEKLGKLLYGGYLSKGYYKDPEKTAQTYKIMDGERWFDSGDYGTLDKEGFFHLIGRESGIINTGGEKVFAEEVEEIILTQPKVRYVCITGVPDERWGEAVTAVVELKEGEKATEEEIREFCRGKMTGHKIPKHVVFIDMLPVTAANKPERYKVKEIAKKEVVGPKR